MEKTRKVIIPVGNDPLPLMFACRTGHGDGVYDVECRYVNETPCEISNAFVDEEVPS